MLFPLADWPHVVLPLFALSVVPFPCLVSLVLIFFLYVSVCFADYVCRPVFFPRLFHPSFLLLSRQFFFQRQSLLGFFLRLLCFDFICLVSFSLLASTSSYTYLVVCVFRAPTLRLVFLRASRFLATMSRLVLAMFALRLLSPLPVSIGQIFLPQTSFPPPGVFQHFVCFSNHFSYFLFDFHLLLDAFCHFDSQLARSYFGAVLSCPLAPLCLSLLIALTLVFFVVQPLLLFFA